MSVPRDAPHLDHFTDRPFSFYPPIVNIEHNEWVYRQGTWSEVLVHNPKLGFEIWIPRRVLGEISSIDEPVMIVGLLKELEYKGGAVWPYQRRVLSMPRGLAEAFSSPPSDSAEPHAPPTSFRPDSPTESKVSRLIAAVLLSMVVVFVLLVSIFRGRESGERIRYTPVLQAELGFTALDDYFAIVRKLGPPASDRWRSETGERQYRALWYPKYSLTIILMGAERDKALYIGAKDKNWKTVHSVQLPSRTNTDSILRNLKPF